ncbi:MAG: hypothetical protein LRZ84_18705 [Desertifilum sp.]|nr:hypothetical protein [Desertifilum sp.]
MKDYESDRPFLNNLRRSATNSQADRKPDKMRSPESKYQRPIALRNRATVRIILSIG